MNQYEKERQVVREAVATGFALALVIIFWLAAGFGLAGADVMIFQMPLWAIAGCVGTWLFAVLLVWFLVNRVFKNMSLEDDDAE